MSATDIGPSARTRLESPNPTNSIRRINHAHIRYRRERIHRVRRRSRADRRRTRRHRPRPFGSSGLGRAGRRRRAPSRRPRRSREPAQRCSRGGRRDPHRLHPRFLADAGLGADRPARHRDARHRARRLGPADGDHHRNRADQARGGRDRGGLGRFGLPPPAQGRGRGQGIRCARRAHGDRAAGRLGARRRRSRLRAGPDRHRPHEGCLGLHRRRVQPLAGGAPSGCREPLPPRIGGRACGLGIPRDRGRGHSHARDRRGDRPSPGAAGRVDRSARRR